MNQHSKPTRSVFQRVLGAGHGTSGALVIGAVSLAAGLLIGVSVASAQHSLTGNNDLLGLVESRQANTAELENQVLELNTSIQARLDNSLPSVAPSPSGSLSGAVVSGPGVVVTLADSASEFISAEGTDVNDMVVHQQDVDAVINALWRGGAEAVAVQGVRLTAATPVRCVGNVILVGTRAYAPPYVIEAIGNSDELWSSLDRDESVRAYRRDAARYQMGWDFHSVTDMTLPAATDLRSPKLAVPMQAQ